MNQTSDFFLVRMYRPGDQMYIQQLLVQERRAVAEKNVQLAGVGERVKKLEKQRVVLLLAILVCACVSVGVLFR